MAKAAQPQASTATRPTIRQIQPEPFMCLFAPMEHGFSKRKSMRTGKKFVTVVLSLDTSRPPMQGPVIDLGSQSHFRLTEIRWSSVLLANAAQPRASTATRRTTRHLEPEPAMCSFAPVECGYSKRKFVRAGKKFLTVVLFSDT